LAPKSNSLYVGYEKAKQDAMETMQNQCLCILEMPYQTDEGNWLRKGYKYSHEYEEHVADMECLPPSLVENGTTYRLIKD